MQQNEQTVVVNETVFRRWDYLAFSVLTAINVVVVGWFLYYWFSPERWQAGSIVLWLFTFQLMYWLAVQQFRWCLLPFMKKPRWMSASPGWKVGVATTFVPGLESIEMLEKTVAALVAMTYPHDTWVLDEGDDDGVKALCLRLGARHFTRKHLKQYQTANGPFEARTKHGNYNAWSEEVGYARYEIITGFDPDHVPYPEFLNQVLGFFNDPRVAYVQAPQVYYNQDASFVARGAAEETYSYYSSTQMASYHMSFPIITGCHHSHRVTALKQVGGFAAHDADDLLITLLYRAAGGIPAEDSGEGDHSGGLDRLPDSATSLGTVGARREVSSLSQARGPFAPSDEADERTSRHLLCSGRSVRALVRLSVGVHVGFWLGSNLPDPRHIRVSDAHVSRSTTYRFVPAVVLSRPKTGMGISVANSRIACGKMAVCSPGDYRCCVRN